MKIISTIILLAVISFTMALIWKLTDGGHIELASALIFAIVPLCGTWYLHKKTSEEQHKKWLLSDKNAFIADIMDIYTSMLHGEIKNTSKILARLQKLQPAILTYGKTNTIRAWNELMNWAEINMNAEDSSRKIERLLRALRKDLGHDDSKLLPGEISMVLIIAEEKHKALEACKDENYDDLVKS